MKVGKWAGGTHAPQALQKVLILQGDVSDPPMAHGLTEVVFVMTGACGTTGGVAAVNVQILGSLSSLVDAGRIELTVLSFSETQADRPPFLSPGVEYHAFRGSKVDLARSMLARVPGRPLFLIDYLRLAQPVLPFAAAGWLRTIIFAHGRDYWERARWIDRLALRSASLVLTNSYFTLKKMTAAVGRVRGHACLLGLPDQMPLSDGAPLEVPESPTLQACDGVDRPLRCQVMLLVGRMHPGERGKGHDAMLGVLPDLLKRFPDVQLVFAGPGDDRDRLAHLASRLQVADAVFITGRVDSQKLAALYQRCYAFTMPSRQEGFGLVHLEAMNFGKPCLGCWDDGAEDVIVDGQTGYLVRDPQDRNELIMKLSALLSDPVRAAEMGHRGFEKLRSCFTAAHFRARLMECIAPFLDAGVVVPSQIAQRPVG